jgi:DNA polymerase I
MEQKSYKLVDNCSVNKVDVESNPLEEKLYCPLWKEKFVPWQNPPAVLHKGIMLVGEAPGETETITKKPFTGGAGKLLWGMLNSVGISKDNLVITNMVACRPPNNKTPTQVELNYCEGRLKGEINLIKPKVIFALGELAMKALTGQTGIQKRRGETYPLLSKWNHQCDVVCILHPAFAMRQRQWIKITAEDLKIINDYQEGVVVKRSFEKPPYIYNPDATQLSTLFEKLSKTTAAVDIETPSELDILTARVIGIAFYGGDEAFALDLNQSDIRTPRWEVMKNYLEDVKANKCTQNGQFDLGVLSNTNHNINVKGLVYDTLLAEHTMNSDLPGNLDFLRGRYTNMPSYKPSAKSMKSIEAWGSTQRMEYNCDDVVATWLVMGGQKKVMTEKQLNVLSNYEIPLIDVCNYMERVGILIDVKTLALTNAALQPKIKALEERYFEPLRLNPRSPVQLKKYFNIASTGRDELNTLIRRKHPQAELMQYVLDYRDMDKIASVYLIGIYNKLRKNRIHAHPKIGGTATGRLSYQSPNLQNIPKNFRNIFIPDTPEHVLIETDYSQLELRVVANIAPEPKMLEMFARGERIHSIIGMERYGKKWDDLTPHEKLLAKAIVFGTLYGSSPRAIAMREGVTVAEAQRLQDIVLKNYPGLLSYLERCQDKFNLTRKATTPFGRIRYLQSVTQAFNTPIQSSASDVTTKALIGIYKAGIDLRITVHDSIIVQCLDKDKKEVVHEVKRIMEQPIPELNGYQFPVKSEVGKNWRDLEEIK